MGFKKVGSRIAVLAVRQVLDTGLMGGTSLARSRKIDARDILRLTTHQQLELISTITLWDPSWMAVVEKLYPEGIETRRPSE